MKELYSFKHVMGANLMVRFLLKKGFDVKVSDEAKEGRAPVLIEEEQYEKALVLVNARIKEIRSRIFTYEK